MKPILYIGESWLGSNARSFKEALIRQGVLIEDIQEEHYFPISRLVSSRIYSRIFYKKLIINFEKTIFSKIKTLQIKNIVVYKGTYLSAEYINKLKNAGCKVLNIFPDLCPLAHGSILANAISTYDIVFTTKIWHVEKWHSIFNFSNLCVFVPHGYDPLLHIYKNTYVNQLYDVVLIATYRPEYYDLVYSLSKYESIRKLKFKICGSSWEKTKKLLPKNWDICPPIQGHAYAHALKEGKICLAPLTTKVIINSKSYPGDQDSARTYELPALNTFYIHLRTPYVQKIFDEETEVPMYGNVQELSEKILRYINDEKERQKISAAAHKRAVPRDSFDNRAKEFLRCLRENKINI